MHKVHMQDKEAIAKQLRFAAENRRGYADFFGWPQDRDIEEWGVVASLLETLKADGSQPFGRIVRRGRPNDPPDLEGLDAYDRRVAIEVTELVDPVAIKERKKGGILCGASWDAVKFRERVAELLSAKHDRFVKLKGGPYPGGYFVVLFTDEPELPQGKVRTFLSELSLPDLPDISAAYLVLSYSPESLSYPSFKLPLNVP